MVVIKVRNFDRRKDQVPFQRKTLAQVGLTMLPSIAKTKYKIKTNLKQVTLKKSDVVIFYSDASRLGGRRESIRKVFTRQSNASGVENIALSRPCKTVFKPFLVMIKKSTS